MRGLSRFVCCSLGPHNLSRTPSPVLLPSPGDRSRSPSPEGQRIGANDTAAPADRVCSQSPDAPPTGANDAAASGDEDRPASTRAEHSQSTEIWRNVRKGLVKALELAKDVLDTFPVPGVKIAITPIIDMLETIDVGLQSLI